MRAPTGLVMVLRALGIKFDAEEVEAVMEKVIAEVPATIEKLEAMNRAFEVMSKALVSIDARLSVMEAQGTALVCAMELVVSWVEQTEPKINKMAAQQEIFAAIFQNKLIPLTEAYGQRAASDSDSSGTGYRDGRG